MNLATRSTYTSGSYLEANPDWHEDDASWKFDYMKRLLDRHVVKPRSLCEIGCGSGEVLRLTSEHLQPVSAVGFEVSPQAFALCQAKASDRLKFVLGSPFGGDEVFDLGLVIDVIEHVEDPFDFLRQVRKITTKQLFHIPLDMNALTVARGWSLTQAREKIGHLHYFTADTALATLRETGFTVDDTFYTPWAIDQSSKTWKKRLASTPRRLLFSQAPDLTVRLVGGWSLLVLTH